MKILLLFGTRPEAIKMAPIIHVLRERADIQCVTCVTAQHREMLDQVLDLFDIVPDIDLNLMTPSQTLSKLTSQVLTAVTEVLKKEKPDIVLVQGDTTTTFAGALAAFYENISIAHIEAGLRTGDLRAPFPEEANRSLTSRLARWHFAPTVASKDNLVKENIEEASITVTGNTVIDALLWVKRRSQLQPNWRSLFSTAWPVLESDEKVILVTGHRRENFGVGFSEICTALARIAKSHPDWHVIYPVHLNPEVQKPVRKQLSAFDNIHLIEPLDYAPFVYLMNRASIVLTDSGGIQEEAPSLGKPVLVMRDKTERPEGVIAGTVKLVGANADRIVDTIAELMTNQDAYDKMAVAQNPYGDGRAAERIVDVLIRESHV